MLVEAGAHPKAVQARLGHASITTTLNTYGHIFPSLDEQATEHPESAFHAARGPMRPHRGPRRAPAYMRSERRRREKPGTCGFECRRQDLNLHGAMNPTRPSTYGSPCW
jgi:hypothetical protein